MADKDMPNKEGNPGSAEKGKGGKSKKKNKGRAHGGQAVPDEVLSTLSKVSVIAPSVGVNYSLQYIARVGKICIFLHMPLNKSILFWQVSDGATSSNNVGALANDSQQLERDQLAKLKKVCNIYYISYENRVRLSNIMVIYLSH